MEFPIFTHENLGTNLPPWNMEFRKIWVMTFFHEILNSLYFTNENLGTDIHQVWNSLYFTCENLGANTIWKMKFFILCNWNLGWVIFLQVMWNSLYFTWISECIFSYMKNESLCISILYHLSHQGTWKFLSRPTRPRIDTEKRCSFHHRGLKCKGRKSRDSWSNRQVWT